MRKLGNLRGAKTYFETLLSSLSFFRPKIAKKLGIFPLSSQATVSNLGVRKV